MSVSDSLSDTSGPVRACQKHIYVKSTYKLKANIRQKHINVQKTCTSEAHIRQITYTSKAHLRPKNMYVKSTYTSKTHICPKHIYVKSTYASKNGHVLRGKEIDPEIPSSRDPLSHFLSVSRSFKTQTKVQNTHTSFQTCRVWGNQDRGTDYAFRGCNSVFDIQGVGSGETGDSSSGHRLGCCVLGCSFSDL